jgi:hypothetical protein
MIGGQGWVNLSIVIGLGRTTGSNRVTEVCKPFQRERGRRVAGNAADAVALLLVCVHNPIVTAGAASPASTTCPGHWTIHDSLGVRVCASKLSLSTLLMVSRMAASHSMSHFSTAPTADLGLKGLWVEQWDTCR